VNSSAIAGASCRIASFFISSVSLAYRKTIEVVASFTRETETPAISALFFAALDVTLLGYCNSVTSSTKAIELGADAIALRRIVGERTSTA
jgi:hypothetical protein